MTTEQIIEAFEQFDECGFISCTGCGAHIEIDALVCECGTINAMVSEGMV